MAQRSALHPRRMYNSGMNPSSPEPPPFDKTPEQIAEAREALRDITGGLPEIEEEFTIEIDSSDLGRGPQRESDNRVLARFFALCLVAIGMMTLFPVVYFWLTNPADSVGPTVQSLGWTRWAYILVFLAAVNWIYSVYVFQVVDFGAFEALAAVLLVMTCVYGFAGMSLTLAGVESQVAKFLQLPSSWIQKATIWVGVMFGVNALACYLVGREAMIWRRRDRRQQQPVAGV